MMDGDLQDPPEILPCMWELLRHDAHDVAYGERTDRAQGWAASCSSRASTAIFATSPSSTDGRSPRFCRCRKKPLPARPAGLSIDENQRRDNGMITLKHVAQQMAPALVAAAHDRADYFITNYRWHPGHYPYHFEAHQVRADGRRVHSVFERRQPSPS